MRCPLSLFHLFGLGALQVAAVLLFVDAAAAPVPLILFALLCLVAPFLPRFGFFLPIVSAGDKSVPAVSITIDDGPDPMLTPRLLDLLDRYRVKATFFLPGSRAEAYPELVREILERGHSLGNHTYSHSPFVMLQGKRNLRREIEMGQSAIARLGVVPLAFRPPVGVTNPDLFRILLDNGLSCVNFTRRAGDMGNRRTRKLAARILSGLRAGDIILIHDAVVHSGDEDILLGEFDSLMSGIIARGLEIVPLERLLGREVMRRGRLVEDPCAAELLYDGLSGSYDDEQFNTPVSISKRTELALFRARAPELLSKADRVMEIGAGTGIFTLPIAALCKEVLGVDVSAKMLAVLESKAGEAGLGNLRLLAGNIETVELEGGFDAICAFCSLEYIGDLPALAKRLSASLKPGGRVYFIMARKSLFRFFVQIGNALRHGIWMRAFSAGEVRSALAGAGFEGIDIRSRLLRCVISGGMLLEVLARKPGPPSAGREAG
jgi:peptidoglycan-N-acetylglucosamine deacetylase